ncbi:MAG TPA: hypothetical protein VFN70_18540, partial [Burkholderiales bacterium]|nr:hypothetical protein [Burkholderiales bacterium]
MPRNRPDVRWRDSRPHPADIGATVWTFFGNPFEGRGGDTQRDFGFRPDLDTKRVYPGEPGWTPVPNPPINLLVPPGPAPLNPITTPPFAGPIPTTPPPPPSPSPSPPTPAPAPAPPRVPGGGGGGSVADYPAPKRPPIQVPRGNPDAWSRLARVLGRLGRLNDPRIQAAWRVGSEIGRQIYERFDVEILDAIDRIVGREQRERASAPRVRNPLSEPARAPAPRARAAPRPRPAEPARAPAA